MPNNPPGAQLNLGDWLNVGPNLAGSDHPDQVSRDPVLLSHFRSLAVRPISYASDSQHVFCGQLRCGVLYSVVMRRLCPVAPVLLTVRGMAPLFCHVGKVLSPRSAPKMRWITAIPYVASVTGVFGRPNASHKEERDAMRVVVPTTDLESRIVLVWVFVRASLDPLPAPAGSLRALAGSLVNVLPKPKNILFGVIGRVKMRFRHGVNLLYRLALWNGSIGAQPSFEPT